GCPRSSHYEEENHAPAAIVEPPPPRSKRSRRRRGSRGAGHHDLPPQPTATTPSPSSHVQQGGAHAPGLERLHDFSLAIIKIGGEPDAFESIICEFHRIELRRHYNLTSFG
uniref:Uncharacterized protein n=2 Tax=Aegilops tauschii subsp. strangulata TaxID=200361 RepID=A0A453JHZ5_AEGTS